MNYDTIDTAARAKALALTTGEGDLSVLTAVDAAAAERAAVMLELRAQLMEAHASGGDRDASAFDAAHTAMKASVTQARTIADRVAAATGADMSGVRSEIVAVNLQKAEADHFDAEWRLSNLPVETAEQTAALELIRDRAAREITALRAG